MEFATDIRFSGTTRTKPRRGLSMSAIRKKATDNTIHRHLSTLSRLLKDIGVRVRCDRKVGYRLEALPEDRAS